MIEPSKNQTKIWRNSQEWYKGGKHNECEIYQRNLIQQITGQPCLKTAFRINWRTLTFQECKMPLKLENGYDWTEDFDGYQDIHGFRLYYNLKFVCDAGGAQTRTLREVYHFIETQLQLLRQNTLNNHSANNTPYFINILDGNTSFHSKKHFDFLYTLPEYKTIKERVFIGDTYTFQYWFKANFNE